MPEDIKTRIELLDDEYHDGEWGRDRLVEILEEVLEITKEFSLREEKLVAALNDIWKAQGVAISNGGGAWSRHIIPAINESRKVLKELGLEE